jgi:hypothetical protein
MTEWKLGKPEVCGVYWARSKEYECHWLVEVGTNAAHVMIMRRVPISKAEYKDVEFGPMVKVPSDT